MKINVTGHNTKITDNVIAHLEEKFAKIASHFPSIITLNVIVSEQHEESHLEVSTTYEGAQISARGTADTLYPAIANAVKKLDAALTHRKGQLKADRHTKPVSTTPEIAHEIIQEMKLVND